MADMVMVYPGYFFKFTSGVFCHIYIRGIFSNLHPGYFVIFTSGVFCHIYIRGILSNLHLGYFFKFTSGVFCQIYIRGILADMVMVYPGIAQGYVVGEGWKERVIPFPKRGFRCTGNEMGRFSTSGRKVFLPPPPRHMYVH